MSEEETESNAEWAEILEELVNKAFDGDLDPKEEPHYEQIIRIAGLFGDRRLTVLFFLLPDISKDPNNPYIKVPELQRNFMREKSDKHFKVVYYPRLTPEWRKILDDIGTHQRANWASNKELLDYYKSAKKHHSGTDIPVDALQVAWMTDMPVMFHGEGNLITVAPPGSGKGQCHVIPNLLDYVGGLFVLDIKGENYEHTEEWRRGEAVGTTEQPPWDHNSVKRFAPGVEASDCWNPLDHVRVSPYDLWEDARALSDMLIVPQGGDYFEERGRDLLTAAIQLVILSGEREATMREVCRILWADTQALQDVWDEMKEIGNETLSEAAQSFQSMADKEFSGVINSVRRSMEIWRSPRVADITNETTEGWTPGFIRDGGAVYVCVPPGKVKMYASVLRVLIGQHIYGIMENRENIAEMPITFFLDEFPQLGYMKAFEDAADVGRDTKIRLWMFCQNLGQLKEHYRNWEGLVSSCNFQCFMNINDNDTASFVAKRMGESGGSYLDPSKRSAIKPADLMGPKYKDSVLILARGMNPIKAEKVWLSEVEYRMNRLSQHLLMKYKNPEEWERVERIMRGEEEL